MKGEVISDYSYEWESQLVKSVRRTYEMAQGELNKSNQKKYEKLYRKYKELKTELEELRNQYKKDTEVITYDCKRKFTC